MQIAIIGSGNIGQGLGNAWSKHGHVIKYGGREPASIRDAVEGAEIVVLAVPFAALASVLAAAGDLAGRIVIDCTNGVAPGMKLIYGHTTSAAEELAAKLPGARVFKSFNAQGAENLANPIYDGVRASNFFCGDDVEGKQIVRQLVEEVGFEAIDAGGLAAARLLEPLMLLWIATSRAVGSRDIAFKVLRR
jgi:predicted dinucleotide-binding enzyme